jgi:hypothetical protein
VRGTSSATHVLTSSSRPIRWSWSVDAPSCCVRLGIVRALFISADCGQIPTDRPQPLAGREGCSSPIDFRDVVIDSHVSGDHRRPGE